MKLWKTIIFSLIYFVVPEALAGLFGLAVYCHHRAHGTELGNTITLMVLCQGLAVWAATNRQKWYFKKILKLKDFEAEGDTRLIAMDKMAGNFIIGLSLMFVVLDCW